MHTCTVVLFKIQNKRLCILSNQTTLSQYDENVCNIGCTRANFICILHLESHIQFDESIFSLIWHQMSAQLNYCQID